MDLTSFHKFSWSTLTGMQWNVKVMINRSSPSLPPFLQVSLHREFVFRNSKQHYNGIPVVASNMDTVGTFESALALANVSKS